MYTELLSQARQSPSLKLLSQDLLAAQSLIYQVDRARGHRLRFAGFDRGLLCIVIVDGANLAGALRQAQTCIRVALSARYPLLWRWTGPRSYLKSLAFAYLVTQRWRRGWRLSIPAAHTTFEYILTLTYPSSCHSRPGELPAFAASSASPRPQAFLRWLQ